MTQKLGRADIHYELLKAQSVNRSPSGSSSGSGVPGGSTGDIQTNDGAGGFAGVSAFHWNNGALVLSIGGDITLLTGADRTISLSNPVSGNGNSLTIRAATGIGALANGGNVIIEPGKSGAGGSAGSIIINPDFSSPTLGINTSDAVAANTSGVSTQFQGSTATGSGNGGDYIFIAGSADQSTGTGNGGSVSFNAAPGGAVSGSGGLVSFAGGAATSGNGGDVSITPGSTLGGGVRGYVKITRDIGGGQPVATLSLDSMTGDHTYTLRDATGTLALLSDIPASPIGANPTGTVGLTVVNGSAATFLRSDGAPPLSQAIAPTWTGTHIWQPTVNGTSTAVFKDHAGNVLLNLDSTNDRVGVGTATPKTTLDIIGVSRVNSGTSPAYPTTGAGFEMVYDSDGSAGTTSGGSGVSFFLSYDRDASAYRDMWFNAANILIGSNNAAGYIAFATNGYGNERMRLDVNGNLVIGATSASARLHVVDSQQLDFIVQDTGSASAQIQLKYASDTTGWRLIDGIGGGTTTFAIYNSATRLAIDTNGKVGIASTMVGAGVTYSIFNVNGSQLFVGADSSQESPMFQIVPSYPTNTHASYKARAALSVWDAGGAREAIRFESNGSAALVGIFGVAAVAQATTGGAASTFVANTSGIANDTATWDSYTIGQVVKALRNIGILA